MDTSTYFELNLVTGSDKVNPLTIDRPNYEKIDDQMHKNQINSVVEATELKSGTVHAITCLTEGAVFFRFTATSDYSAGDTFTFNGTPVSAVLPDGSGLTSGTFKVNGTVLCSIVGTLLTVYSYTASGVAADAEKLGGQLPEYYAKATDAISTYVHSRIGTVNNFVGNGANGKVKIVANIQAGDTIQINGNPVTAYSGADDFVSAVAGLDLVGKTLFFLWDSGSNTVNFKIGGGVVTTTGLAPAAVLTGTTVNVLLSGKIVKSVTGALDVLAIGTGATDTIVYWDGRNYQISTVQSGFKTLGGRTVVVTGYGCANMTIAGVQFPAGNTYGFYTASSQVVTTIGTPGAGLYVVLGTKTA